MVHTKMFEIRDRDTLIAVMAIKPWNLTDPEPLDQLYTYRERMLWGHAGYGRDREAQAKYVILLRIDMGHRRDVAHDHYDWGDRTMHTAHGYIIEHWADLSSGDVVDVRTILGETDTPAVSDFEPRYTPAGIAKYGPA